MKNETKGNTNMMLIVVVAVVALGAGFFGGMQYQKMQGRAAFGQGGQFGNRTGRGSGAFGANGGNRPVVGTILSSDDKSITVQMQDGSSKIVLITGSTTINKAAQATKSDLANGSRVAAYGTTNSDGSITAQNVQLNPMMRGPGGTSGAAGQGTPTTPAATPGTSGY